MDIEEINKNEFDDLLYYKKLNLIDINDFHVTFYKHIKK